MTNAAKLSYEPPAANIWSVEELNSIEAEMSYGDSGWAYPIHPEGSSSNPVSLETGSSHSGVSRICWLRFIANGSYDIRCSAPGATISIYKSFNGYPSGSAEHIANGSMYESYGCVGTATQFVCIKSYDSSLVQHSCSVQQHVDRHYFDNNAYAAYWLPQNGYTADSNIAPYRVTYVPGKSLAVFSEFIKQNRTYESVDTFFDCIDYAVGEAMAWCTDVGFLDAFAVAFVLRVLAMAVKPETAQDIIDRVMSDQSYLSGIRAEEYLDAYYPVCKCTPWNGTTIMSAMPGCIGDWYYCTKEN